ncbi:unnamed protein product [Plutella xylostella]|uniref:(diamondback moth) hypothetical protein n=1 Tax=Plutella xylostella TaxID=51655 RepID=A0A8S4DZS4_PLUXY|nr:unnamed protein product [Plutella xylostella]
MYLALTKWFRSETNGVVDFNMLQAVLHCLAQQLGVLSKGVELRGSAANIPTAMKENSKTINIKEYTYDTDKAPGEITKKDEIGQFPNLWLKAYVLPLPKVPTPSAPNEYRPISILPFLSKILESIVHRQLTSFLTNGGLLNPLQSGFRSGHSHQASAINDSLLTNGVQVDQKLLSLLPPDVCAMEDRRVTILVLIDFSNAFNAVDHDLLLAELECHKVSAPAMSWFSSYLRGRQQAICSGPSVQSDWADLTAGVPQGGILSPLLFSTFINSVTSNLHCSYHLYADDLQIYSHVKIDELDAGIAGVNGDLDEILRWSQNFGISVNPKKCQSIIIGSSRLLSCLDYTTVPPFQFDGRVVPFSPNVTDLGLTIDEYLSWEQQLEKVSRKVYASLHSMLRLKNFLPQHTKLALVNSLLLPILDYADVCYLDLIEKLSLVTVSKFNLLEAKVNDLNNRVYGSMPKNEDMLEEVRSQTNMKAITDMWSTLNVSSRLEAAEEGLAKLSSLIQDLISATPGLVPRGAFKTCKNYGDLEDRLNDLAAMFNAAMMELRGGTAGLLDGGRQGGSADRSRTCGASGPDTDAHRTSLRYTTSQEHRTSVTYPGTGEYPHARMPSEQQRASEDCKDSTRCVSVAGVAPGSQFTAAGGQSTAAVGQSTAAGLPAGGTPSAAGLPAGGTPSAAPLTSPSEMIMTPVGPKQLTLGNLCVTLTSRMNELENMMKDCCQDVHKYECIITEKASHFYKLCIIIQSLDDQMVDLLKKVHDQPEKDPSESEIKDNLEKISEVFDTVNNLQSQLHDLSASAQQLAAEKTERERNINTLLEQIELLKVTKMDREDVIEAMADKVDLQMLTRKVSRDQFETACDDLAKGLENTLEKLNMQESLWQQALDDIQREIETKLDKLELCPVKEFFNSKLRQLQENLKKIAALKREVEAAGTKRKLLRDVKCISCDAEAVMSVEPPPPPAPRAAQPTMSMKPYLTYELDAIRKQQACPVQQRNMRDWEHIGKQMTQVKPLRARSAVSDKHLCSRYCGGSHTVTTAAQRVARTGHFLAQWGPDVLPLTTALAAGDDGKFYRVTTSENVKAGAEEPCTPRTSKKQERTSISGDDCRCLEEKNEK